MVIITVDDIFNAVGFVVGFVALVMICVIAIIKSRR